MSVYAHINGGKSEKASKFAHIFDVMWVLWVVNFHWKFLSIALTLQYTYSFVSCCYHDSCNHYHINYIYVYNDFVSNM